MKTENLSVLKINKLTQEQYDAALAAGKINSNELYLTPEEPIDLSPYATKQELETAKSGISSELAGKQATITGAATTITSSNLTVNRALISDNAGKVAVSAVTSTELGNLSGVTSNIQTQLNNKLSTTGKAADASKLGGIAAADYATTASVETKFANLDGNVTGSGNYVKTISQTDGKITATLGSIAKEDIPDHTDTDGNFGKGDGTNFGHLKLSDSIASDSDVGGGIAATPKAVKKAYTLANTAKSAADAAANQNAFSSLIIGINEYSAPNTTSSLELIGDNVSINATSSGKTGDITVTLGVADGSTSVKGLVQLTDSTTSESTTTAATPNAVKRAYTLAGSAKSAADGAKSRADSAYELAGTKLNANAKAVGAADADKLGGKEPSYYATASDLNAVSGVADAAKTKSETNEAAINVINNTSTGILANAKKYTNKQLNSYSKTADIAKTYETISNVSTKIQAVNQAISTEAQTRSGADELLQDQINTFIGTETNPDGTTKKDAGKSIRTIANEELAAQLIPESAKESLDTLQEIAAWIQGHPDSVSAINADILDVRKEVYGTDDGKAPASGDNKGKSRIDNIDTAIAGINNALAGKQATIDGAASTVVKDNLATDRVLISNSQGKVAASSSITTTELGYLDGVTSNIQTQFNGIATTYATKQELETAKSGIDNKLTKKQNIITGAATTITGSNLDINRALVSNGSGKVAVSAVTSKELGYLSGVTSNIQTQLGNITTDITTNYATKRNLNTEASARENADNALENRIVTLETAVGTSGSVETRIAAALKDAKDYADQSETDAINTVVGDADDIATDNTVYGAKAYADGKEIAITQAYNAKIEAMTANKLNKLTYEWNKSYNAGGTAGYLLIGSFPMYDSNVTIDIDSTTSTTYHGTVVIATQNVSETSIGSAHTITVYGDPTGTISDAIRVVWTAGSRNYNVYFVPSTWSKNLIHIRALGNYLENTDESKICTQFTTGTAPTTTSGLTVVNALISKFNEKLNKTATAADSAKLGGVAAKDYATIASVDTKIANLDGVVTGTSGFVETISQTDGKVTATRRTLAKGDIPDHADSTNKFGSGSGTKFGHLKLSDSTANDSNIGGGVAATPKAVKQAYSLADSAKSAADGAKQAADAAKLTVKQNVENSSASEFPIIFGKTASNSVLTEEVNKSNTAKLKYQPSTGTLTATKLSGVVAASTLSASDATRLSSTLQVTGKTTLGELAVTTANIATATVGTALTSSGVFTSNGTAVFHKDHGVQIGSGVKFTYDDTKKCLNFTFL